MKSTYNFERGGDMKNSKREQLLAALLVAPTVKQAAQSIGMPETTAFSWLRKPEFAEEYKTKKRQTVAEASDYIMSRISAATAIIDNIMNDTETPAQVRLNAAKTILDTAFKTIEQRDILERLEALEAVANDDSRR